MGKWIEYINREKMLFLDLLFILICITGAIYVFQNYSIKELYNNLHNWNSGWHWSGTWYGLFAIYWMEIVFVMFVWDVLWFRMYFAFNSLYIEITQVLVRKKFIWLLVKFVRVRYSFNKLSYYMRLGWIRHSFNSENKLKDYLLKSTILDFVKKVFLQILTIPVIMALLLSLFNNDNVSNVIMEINKEQIWGKGSSFLWEHFTKLSALVVLILIIFVWYFVSSKGVIRRSIAQANRKKLEEVIEKHRHLIYYIIPLIRVGSENIKYAIERRESILDYWTNKQYPHHEHSRFFGRLSYMGDSYFRFKDIPEISTVVTKFKELASEENIHISFWFSRYKYDLIKVESKRLRLTNNKYYEEYLFTNSGFEAFYVPLESNDIVQSDTMKYKTKEVQIHRDFFERHILNNNIVEGIEFLYELHRYIKSIDQLLNVDSDKIGRILRTLAGKE